MSHDSIDTFKVMFAAMGIDLDVIGEYEGFTLTPPADVELFCPTCHTQLLEVSVYTNGDGHGHVEPCGCRIDAWDFAQLLRAGG